MHGTTVTSHMHQPVTKPWAIHKATSTPEAIADDIISAA